MELLRSLILLLWRSRAGSPPASSNGCFWFTRASLWRFSAALQNFVDGMADRRRSAPGRPLRDQFPALKTSGAIRAIGCLFEHGATDRAGARPYRRNGERA